MDFLEYARKLGRQALESSRQLALLSTDRKNRWLGDAAQSLRDSLDSILAANKLDVEMATANGLTAAQVDRLRLNESRVDSIARSLEEMIQLDDPVGELIEENNRPNGLIIRKLRVPLGVIFFVFESRPNVTSDAAGLCLKSGNAVILRGGKEAVATNRALHDVLVQALLRHEIPEHAIQLVMEQDYEVINHILQLDEYVNLAIPRGGPGLIRRVGEQSRIPVLKHYHGVCHVYVHKTADLDMAAEIVINSKCQRPGVCNAAESLLIDQQLAPDWGRKIVEKLRENQVEIRGCEQSVKLSPEVNRATSEDFATEYLGLTISLRIVSGVDQAIEHISQFGSQHTDTIVATDSSVIDLFARSVDSAVVLINASTRFNDGGQFGMGAEVGISTDKFHARGPCGLRELTSYKYVVTGNGQIR